MTTDRTDPYTRLNPRPIPTEDYTREETYGHTRGPVDLAVTLIPDSYTSREFFEIEREKVFATSWVVGFTSQVQKIGQVIVAEVAGRSIIVTRDKQSLATRRQPRSPMTQITAWQPESLPLTAIAR
jgi:choline monooxygenase